MLSHPHEMRQLQLDLDKLKEHADAVKAKAKEHADLIRQNAPGAIANAQAGWKVVSEGAAEKASAALESSMGSTMEMVFGFLKLSDDVVKSLLAILFNVFFVSVMLLGALALARITEVGTL